LADGGHNLFGIKGALHHVNPFGMPTVVNDLSSLEYEAAGLDIGADSHFLVKSSVGAVVRSKESPTFLGVAFDVWNDATAKSSIDIAQLILPPNSTGSFRGQTTIMSSSGAFFLEDFQGVWIPEPGGGAIAAIGSMVVATARCSRRVAGLLLKRPRRCDSWRSVGDPSDWAR
jgi:hypothetical protein